MNRLERLALLALLLLVLVGLLSLHPVLTTIGAAAGIAGGVSVATRLGRLRAKVDAKIGEDDPPPTKGLRTEVVIRRALLQLGVLFVLLLVVTFTPLAGDRAYAALAAAATALPAVLTAQRLR